MNRKNNCLGLAAFALVGTLVAGCAGQTMSAPITLKVGETTSAQVDAAFGKGRVTKTMIAGNPVKICEYSLYAQDNDIVPSKNSLSIKTESENKFSGQMGVGLLIRFTPDDKIAFMQVSVIRLGKLSNGTNAVYSIPSEVR